MKKIIQKGLVLAAGAAIASVLSATSASALLVSVSTNTANTGDQAEILAPPPSQVMDATEYNTAQQGFDEQQYYLLTEDLQLDGAVTIAAGTTVHSHMIFLNRENDSSPNHIAHNNVEWTFSHEVLGVMSDTNGSLEGASSPFLGATGVRYPTAFTPGGAGVNGEIFDFRGMEGGGDGYSLINPYVLSVSMYVTQPGDWIRVITAVPLPAALPLYGAGVALLGFMGWRRRKSEAAV